MEIDANCIKMFVHLIQARADYYTNANIKLLQKAIDDGGILNNRAYGLAMGKMSSYQEIECIVGALLAGNYQALKAYDFIGEEYNEE